MANESYPVSNLEYDLLSVLQKKLEGMEAYGKYLDDAKRENNQDCQRLFQDLMQQDKQHAERLRTALSTFMSQSAQAAMRHQTGTQPGMTGRA